MTAKKGRIRNHYIPRLLLNRFASKKNRKKKKFWTIQFSRKQEPVEVSTKDAALTKYFYGKQETGVENAFQKLEPSFAKLLRRVADHGPAEDLHDELNYLVWCQYIRTKSIRNNSSF